MRLLLDTHIALWAIAADPRLPPEAQHLIEDRGNAVFVSAASVWEITLKHALARGLPSDMPISGPEALAYFRTSGYDLLPVTADHAAAVAALPPLHRDPFDRLIVAQALHEPLRLVTRDVHVKAYSNCILLVQ
ncbi:MAG: PIN domain nuclease [Hyphomicrobium sp.]|nr:PIN domain nuclease [Hyphomicrobium sp.]PPC82703.1 MAG: PIN domain nuclease [Hyphomicrobium sp.]